MKDSPIYEDLSRLRKRSGIAFYVVEVLFLAVVLFYWKIQILDHSKYWSLSEANRTREIVISAPRAVLTDRGGSVVLANNAASFRASIIRENAKNLEESLRKISPIVGLDVDIIRRRLEKYKSLPLFRPIVIKDNLSREEVARIEGRKLDLSELVIETEPKRFYPFAHLAAHVLGTLQELTAEDLRTHFRDRRPGDMAGKSGLEGAYEARLAGIDGKLVEVVDSQGRKRDELDRVEPRQSPKLALTLDYDLQAKAEELLAGKEGAVVVLETKTGGVLALASSPTYDPNAFINRFTPEEWMGLANNPDNPLLNRALQGQYSPGSLFKPALALGALDMGLITEQTGFFCGGVAEFYGRPFHCWLEGGHGTLTLPEAIRQSCNIYFYNLGLRMKIDDIARYAGMLGLGRKTGIDIAGEKPGLVPTSEWKRKTQGAAWYPGETISVAIGQGALQVTPLQVAAMAARIANRGAGVRPHLLMEDDAKSGAVQDPGGVGPAVYEKIIEGMWRSANKQGTGQGARVEGFDVCGKTGSTQVIGRETAERLAIQKKTHSWFMGFAPRNDSKIAVAVLVEFGGMGGATAAPIAGQIFKLYKDKYARQGSAQGN
jgi:penicillin-binding protein 2